MVLMIALLPLRGWVGDVMAMERFSQASVAASPLVQIHDDCHEMTRHGLKDTDHGSTHEDHARSHAGNDCASCTVCQICHSVALPSTSALGSTTALPTAMLQTHSSLHASAERAPGFKQPIS